MTERTVEYTREDSEMADFDPELKEELHRTAAALDGNTAQATIREVTRLNNKIFVTATLPWGQKVDRKFDQPKDDPGGAFEQFVESIGYGLNAAEEIIDEPAPCVYDPDNGEWTMPTIPDLNRREQATAGAKAVWRAVGSGDSWVGAAGVFVFTGGFVLFAPLLYLILLAMVATSDFEDEDTSRRGVIFFVGFVGAFITGLWTMFFPLMIEVLYAILQIIGVGVF